MTWVIFINEALYIGNTEITTDLVTGGSAGGVCPPPLSEPPPPQAIKKIHAKKVRPERINEQNILIRETIGQN